MELKKDSALVVLSGGQDSTTCLGLALDRHEGPVSCVTFDYGQRHKIEIDAAKTVVDFFSLRTNRKIEHTIVHIPPSFLRSASPLTSNSALPEYETYEKMVAEVGFTVEKTFVPMRNTMFLTLAFNIAVASRLESIYTGVSAEDNANYPDCTKLFISRFAETAQTSLGPDGRKFRLQTPLIRLSKADSIHLALRTPHTYDALALSHTSYDGKFPPTGRNHANLLRERGFLEAGVPDPLVVRAAIEGLMEFPTTPNYNQIRTVLASKSKAR